MNPSPDHRIGGGGKSTVDLTTKKAMLRLAWAWTASQVNQVDLHPPLMSNAQRSHPATKGPSHSLVTTEYMPIRSPYSTSARCAGTGD